MCNMRNFIKIISKCSMISIVILMWTHIILFFVIKKKIDRTNINHNDPEDKFILFWTPLKYDPLYYLKDLGEQGFFKSNCETYTCYATDNRNLFGDDTTEFDAIVFSGQMLSNPLIKKPLELPKTRSPHQKYVFYEMESADNYPICDDYLKSFFNWTMTYRLDSDIPSRYVLVKDENGREVGPSRNIEWIDTSSNTSKSNYVDISRKSKSGAWFVSQCTSRSKRHYYFWRLQTALDKKGLGIDVYGSCGYKVCPKESRECEYMLRKDYYFYLAFENSFSEDYVTEKVLTALQNDVVPIVYGGANYSWFLPPGSYIDARAHTPEKLADLIEKLMKNKEEYLKYFNWKHYYTFHDPIWVENLCSLCDAVNNEHFDEYTHYNDIRKWWNPNFEKRCMDKNDSFKKPSFFYHLKHSKKGLVTISF